MSALTFTERRQQARLYAAQMRMRKAMGDRYSHAHPWRGRSRQFAIYLESLSPAERRQVEAAERRYIRKETEPTSTQRAAFRDFDEVMIGTG